MAIYKKYLFSMANNQKADTSMRRQDVSVLGGCLLGAAVGDAIGLPYEGLSPRRARRFAKLPLQHRFVLGRGMVSDDTDHTIFVVQALLRSSGDAVLFRRCLAWRLRCWLLCLPAGIGLATLRGIVRLWLGFKTSGVYSAGNGPAMRSAILGAAFPDDVALRHAHVEASTTLTHTDPKALAGALAVAEVAARIATGEWKTRPSVDDFIRALLAVSSDKAWQACVADMREFCDEAAPIAGAQARYSTGQGVTGYVLHSVPFALLVWFRCFGDYRATIETVTQAGGDVDTVAAIAGALAGAAVGVSGIPASWRDGVKDWPHSIAYLQDLAAALAGEQVQVNTQFSSMLLPRGVLFTMLVLAHGFRRLLPPY